MSAQLDLIERLQKQNAELREVLRRVLDNWPYVMGPYGGESECYWCGEPPDQPHVECQWEEAKTYLEGL